MKWSDLSRERPDLAEHAKRLMYQHGIGEALLATVRKDGGPRVHPVCPILAGNGLYVFIEAHSPKKYDLLRDGRFALHTYPVPLTDESFYCVGPAIGREDPEIRTRVLAAAKHHVRGTEILFELEIERCLYTQWENWGTAEMRACHIIWPDTESTR